jgi:hypothetical protein
MTEPQPSENYPGQNDSLEATAAQIKAPEDLFVTYSRAFDLLHKAQVLRLLVESHRPHEPETSHVFQVGPFVTTNAPMLRPVINSYRTYRANRLEARANYYLNGDI